MVCSDLCLFVVVSLSLVTTCLLTKYNINFLLFAQLAEEHGVKFMETSAKSGLNVETVSTPAKN